jgi:hypothetical protein
VTSRTFRFAGAGAFLAIAALGMPALAHPSELYGPGSNPCSSHTLRDALAYGVLAGFITASALAGWTLLRRGGPAWLAAVGVGVLVVGAVTRRTSTFGCFSDGVALSLDHGHPRLAVVLGVAAAVSVIFIWRRLATSGEQNKS